MRLVSLAGFAVGQSGLICGRSVCLDLQSVGLAGSAVGLSGWICGLAGFAVGQSGLICGRSVCWICGRSVWLDVRSVWLDVRSVCLAGSVVGLSGWMCSCVVLRDGAHGGLGGGGGVKRGDWTADDHLPGLEVTAGAGGASRLELGQLLEAPSSVLGPLTGRESSSLLCRMVLGRY